MGSLWVGADTIESLSCRCHLGGGNSYWEPCGNARPGGRGQGQWVLGELLALVCGSPVVELGSERWALSVMWVTVVASVALIG